MDDEDDILGRLRSCLDKHIPDPRDREDAEVMIAKLIIFGQRKAVLTVMDQLMRRRLNG